jgi:large subunit ribosomal protein L10
MNRDQKAAVIEEVAREIDAAEAIFAIDYRGISVKQSAELRGRLDEAGASFRVVKNRLSVRAADQAGADSLKSLLEGPTALTFVRGDAAVAAKELAAFRREHGLLEFKGGTLDGDVLSAEDIDAISRLPARDVLYGQLVDVTASPLNGLVRGLAGLLSGLASQLGQIRDQGLVGGGEGAEAAGSENGGAENGGAENGNDAAADDDAASPAEEAPGDPVAEAATAEDEEPADTAAEDGDASTQGADGDES